MTDREELKKIVTAETENALKNGGIDLSQERKDALIDLFCDNFIEGEIIDLATIRTQIKNSINIAVKISYLAL